MLRAKDAVTAGGAVVIASCEASRVAGGVDGVSECLELFGELFEEFGELFGELLELVAVFGDEFGEFGDGGVGGVGVVEGSGFVGGVASCGGEPAESFEELVDLVAEFGGLCGVFVGAVESGSGDGSVFA